MRRLVAISLIATAVTGACGHNSKPQAHTSPPTTSSTGATIAGDRGSSTVKPASTPTTAKSGATGTTASPNTGGTTTSSIPPGVPRVPTSVRKACVASGDTQFLDVKTPKGSMVAFTLVFADGKAHETYGGGPAQSEGMFHASFIIKPDVPPGEAKVEVAVNNQGKSEYGEAIFRVAPPGGC